MDLQHLSSATEWKRNWKRSRIDNTKRFEEKPPKCIPKLIISEEYRKIKNKRMKIFLERKRIGHALRLADGQIEKAIVFNHFFFRTS